MRDEAEQYRCLLENRRPGALRTLAELSARGRRARERGQSVRAPLAAVVARAARQLRRREQAAAAWARVAPPAWLADTTVETLEGERRDVLLIRVTNATLAYGLRREQATLQRRLGRLVPGVRRIRFVVAGESFSEDGNQGST
jgi:hypothetical protein